MITTAMRLARVGSRSELAAAALIGLGYPAVLLAALLPHIPFFAAAAALTYLADWYLHHRGSYLVNRLSKVRAGLSIRFLLRQLLLVLLLARTGLAETTLFFTAVAGFLVFYGLQAPHGALTALIRSHRTLPVATRNIPAGPLRIPDAPPRFLLRRAARKMLHLDLPAVAGVLTAAATGEDLVGYAGIAASLGLGLLYTAVLVPYLLTRRVPPAATVLDAVNDWLRAYRPTVVLYFSGSAASAYQANMWLETMERIDGRPLILMRERELTARLNETPVPVLCVPGGTHAMNLDLSTVRVALYAANVGKNIHLLRRPTMKHVFIGHGDSDKLASVNPFSKVYDEVWTAGRAGRDRYAVAEVGVPDGGVVEVGRPQLAPIAHAGDRPVHPIPTVLYAPTWEGWEDDPGNTSLLLAGENIVRRLLAAEPPVRVLYKPHPFTGLRDPGAKAAHERVTALVEAAAAERRTDPRWAAGNAGDRRAREEAAARAARIDAGLARLRGPERPGGDEAERSRDSLADPGRLARAARLRTEWNEAYWSAAGWWEHRVVTGNEPGLYDCFNESDALVSDISSVVSDFMASGKPYAITDSAGLGADEFRRQYTAAGAAVILGNDAAGLDELLAAVASPGDDPLAGARRELKHYLLGPDHPTSMERFNAAVRALQTAAEARNRGVARRIGEQAAPARRPEETAERPPSARAGADGVPQEPVAG